MHEITLVLELGDLVDTFQRVVSWLESERHYQHGKFGGFEEDKQKSNAWWEQQFNTYLGRVEALTLDTPAGRQALCKLVATGLALMEVYAYSHDLPSPGNPSGQGL